MLMPLYVFENIDILLKNHGSDGALIKINACDCMNYLTKLADPNKMFNDILLIAKKDMR